MTPGGTHLVLIGYRGSGKTAVGRRLAEMLSREFVDTDELVEAQSGRAIREIFAADGEAAFRDLESRALLHAVTRSNCVISVGGGAILSEQNRGILRAAADCIWLQAPPEELLQRLQLDPRTPAARPSLTSMDAMAEIRHLLSVREPFYRELSSWTIDTSGLSPDHVAQAVSDWVLARGRAPGDPA